MRELRDLISGLRGEWVARGEYDSMVLEQQTRFAEQQHMIQEVHDNVVTLSGAEIHDAP